MDKTTKWLRVKVSTDCYNEIVRSAREDDRDLPTFLRRHLEAMFPFIIEESDLVPKAKTNCDCIPGSIAPCEKCRRKHELKPGLTGVSVHGVSTGCLFDGAPPDAIMGLVCSCPKCAVTS